MNYGARLKRASEEMKKRDIGMMFLPKGSNLWYLVGVPRPQPELTDLNHYGDDIFGAYISADGGCILAMSCLLGASAPSAPKDKPWINEVRVIEDGQTPEYVVSSIAKSFKLGNKGIAIDDRARFQSGLLLRDLFPNSRISLASEIIAPIRMIKDADEIAIMIEAAEITDAVYTEVIKFLKIGVTERDVVHEIERQFARRNVEYPAFTTGVRFTGAKYPFDMGSSRRRSIGLEKSNAITFDFGVCYQGYCSDFGRTAFVGEPPIEFQKAYRVVVASQEAAIKAMVSGKVTAIQLDSIARSIIKEAGYDKQFIHGLCHGIGVSVHEPPYLYPPHNPVLLSGMTLAVEPSIAYISGQYICRLEDVVLVTNNGGKSLTEFHKQITVID